MANDSGGASDGTIAARGTLHQESVRLVILLLSALLCQLHILNLEARDGRNSHVRLAMLKP